MSSKNLGNKLYGGIEAGGTKFVCAVGSSSGGIIAKTEITTRNASDTLEEVCAFFEHSSKIVSLGIGSFGPLNLNPSDALFGHIMDTQKPGWENTDIKGILENRLGVSVRLETDVNCAALGEKYFGLAKQVDNFVYLTVGTGIGGCLMIDGKPYNGASNLEMGHIRIPHELFEDGFQGVCSLHKDCLEGIACGRAMLKRWGKKAEANMDLKAWELEAQYLGMGVSNIILTIRPTLFILGGGVMKHVGLIDNIRKNVESYINGYIELPPLDSFIISSNNPDNGVLGAIKLATTMT